MIETFHIARWLFIRLLSVAFFFAFASLGTQVLGLFGSKGIVPVAQFLRQIEPVLGVERFWLVPTLTWINASDTMLLSLCWLGIAAAILCIAGVACRYMMIIMWVFYLSLVSVGNPFLSFQWDALLLETAFLAIFFCSGKLWEPWSKSISGRDKPSMVVIWLIRLLLFRLMCMSGMVKLASGDPTWSNLTALDYHYWTQPLQTMIGWFAAHFPTFVQRASVVMMLFIELAVPFAIFVSRKARIAAAICLTGLQVLIALTGNYAYFNLLSVCLCLPLLDDTILSRLLRLKVAEEAPAEEPVPPETKVSKAPYAIALGALIALAGVSQIIDRAVPLPEFTTKFFRIADSFRLVNGYGLFAVMTTTRPEIIVEGSNDGLTWQPYIFKYKPGPLDRPPPLVAPLQPRLDWQMWFAALGAAENSPWFASFVKRLLDGEPSVLALLETNPFPEKPPKYIRANVYNYTVTDLATWRETGNWWQRAQPEVFFPIVGLR